MLRSYSTVLCAWDPQVVPVLSRTCYNPDKVRFFEARKGWSKLDFAPPLTSFNDSLIFTEAIYYGENTMLVRTDSSYCVNN